MPLYEYRCPECATTFEQRRPMSESDRTASCPAGHGGARRVLSVFAAVGAAAPAGGATAGGQPGPCGGSCACFPD